MRPLRAVGLALLLTLAVGACGSTTPTGSIPLEPSATASVAASAASTLPDFEGRLRDATAREGALIRALASATTGSPADIRLVVGQMESWVRSEREWLTSHPPDACYQDAADAFTTAIDGIETAAALLGALAAASPAPSDDTTGQQAGEQLSAATEGLAQAAELARTARSACP